MADGMPRFREVPYHVTAQLFVAPEGVVRPELRGHLWIVFGLPLGWCSTGDKMRHAPPWVYKRNRERLLGDLTKQWMVEFGRMPTAPLPNPQLLCVRYSSVEPDKYSDWAKQAIDCLQPCGLRRGKPFYGLGLIKNDRPKECDVHQWWEPAKPEEGFCAIEVRSTLWPPERP